MEVGDSSVEHGTFQPFLTLPHTLQRSQQLVCQQHVYQNPNMTTSF